MDSQETFLQETSKGIVIRLDQFGQKCLSSKISQNRIVVTNALANADYVQPYTTKSCKSGAQETFLRETSKGIVEPLDNLEQKRPSKN